ncbi:YihY/virulence factor BrkB family protein [Streptomyces sp. 549]|uniref:YihY/virulence factor BrkB family protein n=1 Tax=Streptomyces sp. 549 TaxID=3049076 RepID=UPI0024C24149|nr:YihY/virulence factor BrkB family protein [Streptomyces sp. 549]MDK1472758.1 YihY/virulence factor BrkB family protein [Streptomyces sp. 549]
MEWLIRQPVIGPLLVRLMRTHLWRAYERLEETHWARLAAAITFISFLSVFPMLALGAAVAAAFLSDQQIEDGQEWLSDQVPGISDQIGLQTFVDNAGTVGLIAGVLLLFTGLNWVRSLRECLREVWKLPDDKPNLVVGRLKDLGVLLGLGAVGVLSLAGSTFAVGAVEWTADRLGIEHAGPVGWLMRLLPIAAALLVDFLLLGYVLTRVPGVTPGRRTLVEAAVMGAVGFELLKLLLGGYLTGVAGKSMYGAFGVPIALLLWINFMSRLLLFCAAWSATEHRDDPSDPDAGPGAGTAGSNAGPAARADVRDGPAGDGKTVSAG